MQEESREKMAGVGVWRDKPLREIELTVCYDCGCSDRG